MYVICRMMNHVVQISCSIFLIVLHNFHYVTGNWIQLEGDDVGNQPSQYDFIRSSHPGSRAAAATWSDKTGNLWMFGGLGYGNTSAENPLNLNDFWFFNITSSNWSLLSGEDSNGKVAGNRDVPVPRKGASACGVHGVIFVLFGGEINSFHKLNDTWLYNIENKTWIPLFKAINNPHNPPPRSHASSWCSRDHLIIYGGSGKNDIVLNDMWQFCMKSFTWEVLRQHVNIDLGHSFPPARTGAATWIQKNSLYMFGGSNTGITKALYKLSSHNVLSDFWQYDLNNQSWIKLTLKQSQLNDNGFFWPCGRIFSSTWKQDGNLYLFGGYGIDCKNSNNTEFLVDFWKFNVNKSTWLSVQVSNEHLIDDSATSLNAADKDILRKIKYQVPSQRCCAVVWCYKHLLFVFGGLGYDHRSHIAYLNDLFLSANQTDILVFFSIQYESRIHRMVRELSPTVIFAICFASFGGVVFIFGAIFFLKKMIDYPNHAPLKNNFNVKYSPINEEISLDA